LKYYAQHFWFQNHHWNAEVRLQGLACWQSRSAEAIEGVGQRMTQQTINRILKFLFKWSMHPLVFATYATLISIIITGWVGEGIISPIWFFAWEGASFRFAIFLYSALWLFCVLVWALSVWVPLKELLELSE